MIPTPNDKTIPRPFVALAVALLMALPIAAGHAGPVLFQDGLPRPLVIEYETGKDKKPIPKSLEGQIATLTALAEAGRATQPKQGFLQKLLGSSQGPTPVAVEDLLAHADQLRGRLVAVEGLFESTGKDARLHGMGDVCSVSLPDAVPLQGFPDSKPDGFPTRVTGTVEMKGAEPVIRATEVSPSPSIAIVRKARVQEMLGRFEEAIATYLEAEGALRGAPGDLAAFARVRAGQICYGQLDDKKHAAKHYGAAWTTYVSNVAGTSRVFHAWVPQPKDRTWQKQTVHDAIGETLNSINAQSFWYSFVGFFVAVCGGNAALGCLLLAFVVRTMIWPLTKKQLDSAAAMKKLQPQIKALQAKFADDKQKFQQEFWRLCQANGVNPLGGCVPLIIQMPVLIMVYQGIRLYIVEFDKASFLWVPNLAGPDMPLLIAYTISMILFQKMTQKTNPGAAMDPQQEQQQKMMMYMMPLMFFFMFKTFPAAFILYWLGTNIVYFAQQWNYMRKVDASDHVIAPRKSGGFVEAMARMLSGDPDAGGDAKPADEEQKPDADTRSLDEIRKEEKTKGRKKHR